MKQKQNYNVYEKYCQYFTDSDISKFVENFFKITPDYFWTLLCSTSSMHHGKNEMLVDHVDACCWMMVEKVWRQMDSYWNGRTKQLALAGMLVHDNWRCGYPGQEEHYTQDIIDKRGYPQEILGNLKTSKHHPYIGSQMIESELALMPNASEDFKIIVDAVKYHYGPWGEPIALNLYDYTSPIIQVHNIDFHQTGFSEFVSNHDRNL